MLDIALITDMHIGPLPPTRLRELASKRLLGYLSWRHRRHLLHRVEALEAIVTDLQRRPADHTIVAGDLVNIALPAEFPAAARWLERLGAPIDVSAVPGNHDAYAAAAIRAGWEHWRHYMCGDGAEAIDFPYVRRRRACAIVGLSSAVPSPIGFATGKLGRAQLHAVDNLLEQLGHEGLFRIVVVHHPPLPTIPRRRHLRDAPALRAILARRGAELVVSGHEHRFDVASVPGPNGAIPVVVGPSASLMEAGRQPRGGYVRLRVDTSQHSIDLELRALAPGQGRMRPIATGTIVKAAHSVVFRSADSPRGH